METPNNQPHTKLVYSFSDLVALGIGSRASIYRRVKSGDFPVPIGLGGRRIGWRAGDIERWLATRPERTQLRADP